MRKTALITVTGIWLIFAGMNVSAQTRYHKVKVKMNFTEPFIGHTIWHYLSLHSLDAPAFYSFIPSNGVYNFTVDSIPPGDYEVRLNSVFGHNISTTVSLRKKKKRKLRYDHLDSFYQEAYVEKLVTESIMDQDTLMIFYNEAGCFNFDKGMLWLTRLDDNRYKLQRREAWGVPEILDEVTINSMQFAQIVSFEKKLEELNGYQGCTSAYCYSFQVNGQIKHYQFADCEHYDFFRLMHDLFKESDRQ